VSSPRAISITPVDHVSDPTPLFLPSFVVHHTIQFPALQKQKANLDDLPKKSLFCLTLDNPMRKVAVNIINSKWFDRFIMSLIFFNCGRVWLPLFTPFFRSQNTNN
jgi:hypothetical protein